MRDNASFVAITRFGVAITRFGECIDLVLDFGLGVMSLFVMRFIWYP